MGGFQCAGTTVSGRRCNAWVNEEGAFCLFHDPVRTEEAREARAKGGRRALSQLRKASQDQLPNGGRPPETAAEAMLWSAWLVPAVAKGAIGTTVADKIGAALRTFLQALDKSEMESQVGELRTKLKELQKREAAR